MIRQGVLFFNLLALVGAADNVTDSSSSSSSIGNLRGSLTTSLNVARNKTGCDILNNPDGEGMNHLPPECSCTEPTRFSMVVTCEKQFNHEYFNDTIGIKANIQPCAEPASSISLDITEKDHNIDYAIAGIKAGEEKNLPIPGLSIAVPAVGHAGVDAAILIEGNPDSLTLQVGLNACVAAGTGHQVCASSIPILNRILPFYVLKGTYSFGSWCNNTSTVDDNNSAELSLPSFYNNKDNDDDEEDTSSSTHKITLTSNIGTTVKEE